MTCEGCGTDKDLLSRIDPVMARIYIMNGKGWYNPVKVIMCGDCYKLRLEMKIAP